MTQFILQSHIAINLGIPLSGIQIPKLYPRGSALSPTAIKREVFLINALLPLATPTRSVNQAPHVMSNKAKQRSKTV